MDKTVQELEINPSEVSNEIEILIKNTMKKLNRAGAVVGLSGGLDSAVTATLTVRSLGKARVHLFNMPEKDSKPIHKKHAKKLANYLGIKLKKQSITPMVRAAKGYRNLPIRFIPSRKIRGALIRFGKSKLISPENEEDLLFNRLNPVAHSWIARGNAYAVTKHRMRMVLLYQYSELNNLMVVGAANRTEWLTGTFSKWGVDHCADLMPVLHLYRSQLEVLAEYLDIPDYIRKKKADPDIIPGIETKDKLLGNFSLVDQILVESENDHDIHQLYEKFDQKTVDHVLSLKKMSAQMRESPYNLMLKS